MISLSSLQQAWRPLANAMQEAQGRKPLEFCRAHHRPGRTTGWRWEFQCWNRLNIIGARLGIPRRDHMFREVVPTCVIGGAGVIQTGMSLPPVKSVVFGLA